MSIISVLILDMARWCGIHCLDETEGDRDCLSVLMYGGHFWPLVHGGQSWVLMHGGQSLALVHGSGRSWAFVDGGCWCMVGSHGHWYMVGTHGLWCIDMECNHTLLKMRN